MAKDETTLRVAAVQLNSQDDVPTNLARAAHLVAQAARQGAKLVVLPENFAFFGSDDARREHAEPLWPAGSSGPGNTPTPIQSALSALAREHGVAIVGGGMPTQSSDPRRPHNSAVAFAPSGQMVGAYHKIHLFDVDLSDGTQLCESRGTMPGERPVVLELGGLRVGLAICYDLRFPELFRSLISERADLILLTAAFTTHTGKDHWEVLLRARAIEDQVWVLAAAQFGSHGRGRFCYGHSMLIDPWGAVVARASDGVGVVAADLDLSHTARVRQGLPALAHRRL